MPLEATISRRCHGDLPGVYGNGSVFMGFHGDLLGVYGNGSDLMFFFFPYVIEWEMVVELQHGYDD